MTGKTVPSRIWLAPAQWVKLPGTHLEVLLHGKFRPGNSGLVAEGGIDIVREPGEHPQTGGWNLIPVAGHSYVRRAR